MEKDFTRQCVNCFGCHLVVPVLCRLACVRRSMIAEPLVQDTETVAILLLRCPWRQ
jgi:hypothetical protein